MTRAAILFATLDNDSQACRCRRDFTRLYELAQLDLGFPRQNDKLRVEFQSCKNNQGRQQREMSMLAY
jgi:hypothetical protein